jgi:hypothetical protein
MAGLWIADCFELNHQSRDIVFKEISLLMHNLREKTKDRIPERRKVEIVVVLVRTSKYRGGRGLLKGLEGM